LAVCDVNTHLAEQLVAVTAIGGIRLLKYAKSGGLQYQKSKNIVFISLGLAVSIWFFGIMAMGVEWTYLIGGLNYFR